MEDHIEFEDEIRPYKDNFYFPPKEKKIVEELKVYPINNEPELYDGLMKGFRENLKQTKEQQDVKMEKISKIYQEKRDEMKRKAKLAKEILKRKLEENNNLKT